RRRDGVISSAAFSERCDGLSLAGGPSGDAGPARVAAGGGVITWDSHPVSREQLPVGNSGDDQAGNTVGQAGQEAGFRLATNGRPQGQVMPLSYRSRLAYVNRQCLSYIITCLWARRGHGDSAPISRSRGAAPVRAGQGADG